MCGPHSVPQCIASFPCNTALCTTIVAQRVQATARLGHQKDQGLARSDSTIPWSKRWCIVGSLCNYQTLRHRSHMEVLSHCMGLSKETVGCDVSNVHRYVSLVNVNL